MAGSDPPLVTFSKQDRKKPAPGSPSPPAKARQNRSPKRGRADSVPTPDPLNRLGKAVPDGTLGATINSDERSYHGETRRKNSHYHRRR